MRARLAPGAGVRGDVRGRLAGPAAGNATIECMSGKFGEFSQQDGKANGEHGERGRGPRAHGQELCRRRGARLRQQHLPIAFSGVEGLLGNSEFMECQM